MALDRRGAARWAISVGMLLAVVLALAPYRTRLDPIDSVLPLLIVVLLGSAAGGRALGFTLALLGFAAIDYLFQPPFDTFVVHKAHDWLVLGAFLITAATATQLLARAQAEAAAARRRTAEVQRIAELGAETLAAGRAEESLRATADVIRRTLGLRRCDIFVADADGALRWATSAARDAERELPSDATAADTAAQLLRAGPPLESLGALPEGVWVERFLPLHAHQRPVGVLRLVDDRGQVLDEAQRTFLTALTHYAALAAERVRLVADAEHAAALREADRLKDMVLASMSHDLRTPLTTIKALAHTAARRGDADAAAIEEQADRLTRLVADVLDLSRARSGAIPLALELNAVEDLVGAAVRQTRGLFTARRLERRLDGDGDVLVGRFDFVASLRVLGNLLENAAKYSPPDQPVELWARRDGASLLFEVADRGPGVPESERARIFAPFYRAPGTAADVGGAGLGLAVAQALAEAQGGAVAYVPRPGGGSVFTLRLPAADVDPASLGDEPSGPAAAAGPAPSAPPDRRPAPHASA